MRPRLNDNGPLLGLFAGCLAALALVIAPPVAHADTQEKALQNITIINTGCSLDKPETVLVIFGFKDGTSAGHPVDTVVQLPGIKEVMETMAQKGMLNTVFVHQKNCWDKT